MLDDVKAHVCWETPRGRYDECNSKFSLTMKPRFNRTSRRNKPLLNVLVDDFGRVHYQVQQLISHKYRGSCVDFSISKSVEPNEELTVGSIFSQVL